jgi:hypothetical protein
MDRYSPQLETVKNAPVQYDMDPANVSYNFLVNSLSVAVAALQETGARQASGVETQTKSDGAPSQGIIGTDGKIFTGYYKNFRGIPFDDQQAIFRERERLNINGVAGRNKRGGGGRGRGGSGRGGSRNVGQVKVASQKLSQVSIAKLLAWRRCPQWN